MILPAPIDLVTPALVADVGREAHAAARILVRRRGVNQVGAVNHHITGYNQVAVKLDAQLAKLEAIKATDLPAFNKLVREQEVPAIVVSKKATMGGMR
jgi:hypothetical protein